VAKGSILQNNFASGVLDKRAQGRTDLDLYYKGLQRGDNLLTIPLGGAKRRPGQAYIDFLPNQLNEESYTPTMPEGCTANNINDYDYATSTQTSNGIATNDPYVVAEYDFSGEISVYFIDILDIFLTDIGSSSGTTGEFKIQVSDNGSTWNDYYDLQIVDTNPRSYRAPGVTTSYIRLVKIGGADLDTSKVNLTGFWIYTDTGVVSEVQLLDFSVNDQSSFLIALTDRSYAIYQDNTLYSYLPSRFSNDQIKSTDAARSDYVTLLVQEDVPPQRLIYDVNADIFLIDDIPFQTIPQFDYADENSPVPVQAEYTITFSGLDQGQLFRLRLESFETVEIVWTSSTASVADGVRRALEALPIVGAGGVTVASVGSAVKVVFSDSTTDNFGIFEGYVTTGDFADKVNIANPVPGSPRKEDVWGVVRGYPRTIAFFQNRLWFGGTKSKFQSLFASRVNSFFDFELDIGEDQEPIFVTLDSKRQNTINALVSSRRLAIFTEGSEFVSNEGIATPSNFAVELQTSYGTRNINPVDVEGNILFLDKDSGALRGFLYNFGEDNYSSNNLSLISSDLMKNPVDMSFAVGAANEDSVYVFIITEDGNMTVYNTLRSQEVSNFMPMYTQGDFKSVVGIRTSVYMAVDREIDGANRLVLEQWDNNTYTDMNIYQDLGSPQLTITGLDPLNGVECRVKADGAALPDLYTPVNGEIELADAAQIVEVGLNYNLVLQIMPLAPNFGFPGVMHRKKVAQQRMLVFETNAFTVDGKIAKANRQMTNSENSPLTKAPPMYSGVIDDTEGQLGWDVTLAPLIELNDPMDFTMLMIETEVEVN